MDFLKIISYSGVRQSNNNRNATTEKKTNKNKQNKQQKKPRDLQHYNHIHLLQNVQQIFLSLLYWQSTTGLMPEVHAF